MVFNAVLFWHPLLLPLSRIVVATIAQTPRHFAHCHLGNSLPAMVTIWRKSFFCKLLGQKPPGSLLQHVECTHGGAYRHDYV